MVTVGGAHQSLRVVLLHAGEAARVRGLTTLGCDLLYLLLGAVGEVAGVGVVGHCEGSFEDLSFLV